MQISKLIVLLGAITYLIGCGETTVVLNCTKPQSLEVISGLKLGGEVSVKKAQGAIDASIGKELKADFDSSDPDKWISIASTYQYQMCKFINSSSCGDLNKDECLTKKQGMFNGTFDKINTELKSEKERRAARVAEQLGIRVESCVASKVSEYQAHKKTSTEGGARAQGPGLKGGTRTDTRDVCHRVGSNQRIVSATTSSLSCHGGRCSVTAPSYQNNNTKACVTTKAWSESTSFGGGGSAKYRLNVVYYNVATTTIVDRFNSTCVAENS